MADVGSELHTASRGEQNQNSPDTHTHKYTHTLTSGALSRKPAKDTTQQIHEDGGHGVRIKENLRKHEQAQQQGNKPQPHKQGPQGTTGATASLGGWEGAESEQVQILALDKGLMSRIYKDRSTCLVGSQLFPQGHNPILCILHVPNKYLLMREMNE